ncbi:MAG: PAS domain S-box protein [Syntrophobacteria bacterium]
MPRGRPSPAFVNRSLNAKLILAMFLALGLTMLIFALVSIRYEKRVLTRQVVESANQFSETVKNSTRHDMLRNEWANVQSILEAVAAQEGVRKVRIFSKHGEILLSTDSSEMGTVVDKQAEACYACHARETPLRRLSMESRSRIFREASSQRVLGIINPIYNEPACFNAACHVHPREQEVLGVLDIDMSLAGVDRKIHKQVASISLLTLCLFLCLSATLYLCLLFLVLRPVRRLTEQAEQMAKGDYDALVNVSSVDELGQLATSFNNLSTNLKQRTMDLIKKRKDYQALISSVSNYVVAINRNFEIIMTNERFKREFGSQPEDICYRVWKNRDRKCENCVVEKSFHDGESHTSEETVVFRDGRQGRVEIHSTPVKNEWGEIIYVLETATDLTEKRKLEEEVHQMAGRLEERVAERLMDLQASEEKYRTIFERCQDMILLTDPQGRLVDINPSGVKMLGYRVKEDLLVMDTVAEPFEDPSDLVRFRQQLQENGTVKNLEARLRTRQGETLDVLLSGNLISDERGQVVGYEAIIRDITLRTQIINEMRRNSEQLSALHQISLTSSSLELNEALDNTIETILSVLQVDSARMYLMDEEGQNLYLAGARGLSKRFTEQPHVQLRALGEGLLGRVAQQGETVIVENLNQVGTPYMDAVQEEGLQSVAYIPLHSKGRTLGVLCVSSHFSQSFSGQQVEFLTSIGNQIGLAVENANLYEKTRKALEEVRGAQEQVVRSEKLASLGKLAATIAHEINNPIAVVLTYIRLMFKLINQQRFTPERLEDINRYLTTMESETSRCGDIVKNLLAFARQSQVDMKANSIREIIDKTLLLISHDLKLRGTEVVKQLEEDLPFIQCDFKQIQQAFLNVLSNAGEAMQGGGVLTVQAYRATEKGFVEVAITDSGCGIPQQHMKDIFEPFFTTKEEGKGVGLGLAVVYGIITRHRGTIEVESPPVGAREGSGTCFRIRLPIAVEEQTQRWHDMEIAG